VPNHVGPKHPWVSKPPLADWFHGTPQRHLDSSAGISGTFYGKPEKQKAANDPFETLADPHAPANLSRNLTQGWFFNVLPDLNTEKPEVADYLLQNCVWWAESSGLDGFRLDTFPYVSRNFWSDWEARLHRIYPYITTIGEVFYPDPSVTSFFAGGQRRFDRVDSGLDTLFDFPMYFTLRDVLLRNEPVGRIADVLRHDSLYVHPDLLVTFFANHDVPRFASAEGSSATRVKLALGLTVTLRGIPELYYGDEIGMPGGGDPDNRRDFPGGWAGDPKNAFNAGGRTQEQQDLFTYAQTLLRLRREHPSLQSGRLWHLFSDETAYVFLRETEEERVVVAFNNSNEARELKIPVGDTPAQGIAGLTPLLGHATAEVSKSEIRIAAPAQSISIFLAN
jgi:glycosidase